MSDEFLNMVVNESRANWPRWPVCRMATVVPMLPPPLDGVGDPSAIWLPTLIPLLLVVVLPPLVPRIDDDRGGLRPVPPPPPYLLVSVSMSSSESS